MDYGKLSKAALLEMCESKGISYSSSMTKIKLEELLVASDSENINLATKSPSRSRVQEEQEPLEGYKVDTLAKVGAIWGLLISPISSALLCLLCVLYIVELSLLGDDLGTNDFNILIIMFLGIIALIMFKVLFVWIFSILILMGRVNKVVAGIAIIVFSLIPGILILASKYESKRSYNEQWGTQY